MWSRARLFTSSRLRTELLITQSDKDTALNAVLTVYKYDGDVCKLGDYTNEKGSFVSWFRQPGNPMFPGLYDCWHSDGQEYCRYIWVVEGELVCEPLWQMDRTEEHPVLTELSGKAELVADSINAFPAYEYSENLLESYSLDEMINQVNGETY